MEKFEEKITMLEAYRDLYKTVENQKSWYDVADDSPYAMYHRKAIENVLNAIKKLADI